MLGEPLASLQLAAAGAFHAGRWSGSTPARAAPRGLPVPDTRLAAGRPPIRAQQLYRDWDAVAPAQRLPPVTDVPEEVVSSARRRPPGRRGRDVARSRARRGSRASWLRSLLCWERRLQRSPRGLPLAGRAPGAPQRPLLLAVTHGHSWSLIGVAFKPSGKQHLAVKAPEPIVFVYLCWRAIEFFARALWAQVYLHGWKSGPFARLLEETYDSIGLIP